MLATLRHRVTLKPPKRTYEGGSWSTGYPEADWMEVYAAVQPMSGPERAMYRRIESGVDTKIIIRELDSIEDSWLVSFRGQDYEIDSLVRPDFRNRTITLLCKEKN